MKDSESYKYLILFSLLISFLFLTNEVKASQLIEKGMFDLQHTKLSKHGPYHLDGQWEFYWNAFVGDENIKEAAKYVHVPNDWANYSVEGEPIRYGYATYQMVVHLHEADVGEIVALYMPCVSTAYELRVNNQLLATNGVIGTTYEQMKPQCNPHVVAFEAKEQKLHINIQVSNFYHRKSGVWESIKFGTYEQISQIRERNLLYQIFIVGCTFIIGYYHLIMFLQRKKELSFLYFSLTCFAVVIRTLILNDVLLLKMVPFLSWTSLETMEYIAAMLALLFFLLFVRQEHLIDIPLKLHTFFVGTLMIYSVFILVTEPLIFTNTFSFLKTLTMTIVISIFIGTTIGLIKGRRGSRLNMVVFLALAAAVLNDLFYYSHWISTNELVSVGILFYLFIQSAHLARKFSLSFDKVERMSVELQTLNFSLEKEVKQRTAALQVANQELKKIEQSRKRLFASISHELNTPLTFIQGYIKAMMDGVVPKNNSSYLRMIYGDTQMMAHIVNDLQELSKLESGKVKFSFQHVDIREFLKQYYQEQKYAVENRDLKLMYKEYRVNDNEKIVCFIDVVRIKQVMINLLMNATKHTSINGTITISLELLNSRRIKISVTDVGTGIPDRDLPNIFEQFYKVESKENEVHMGAGLGLAIVKEIVAIHDGTVSVTSEEDKGSCFSFTLPIKEIQKECSLVEKGESTHC